ncbi:MAG: ABC transporter permease [Mycobacteriales bacterium]
MSDLPVLRRLASWDVFLCVFVVCMFVFGNELSNVFGSEAEVRTAATVFNTLRNVGEIMLIALPMTMLIISGEIDLSVGSAALLSSCVIGKAYESGLPMWQCALLGILTGALGGALNGFLVTRLGLQSLAVTIGTLALYRGLGSVILENNTIAGFPKDWVAFGYSDKLFGFLPKVWLVVIPVAVLFTMVLRHSKTGRAVYAIGLNGEAARFSGLQVQRIKFGLFVATGAMAGVGGLQITLRQASASPTAVRGLELAVIAAVLFGGVSIFGGRGGLFGVINAVLFLGLSRTILRLSGIKPNVLTVVTGGLLLASVIGPALSARLRAFQYFSRPTKPVESESRSGQTRLPDPERR